MFDMEILSARIKNASLKDVSLKIIGKNAAASEIFTFLCHKSEMPWELLLLCTKNGFVLNTWGQYGHPLRKELIGSALSLNELSSADQSLVFLNVAEDFLLIAENASIHASSLLLLQQDMESLLHILYSQQEHYRQLLYHLDATQSAISMFDQNATLLFANRSFCKNSHIHDRQAAIGMNISDVLKQANVQVRSIETNSIQLKMMDVLNSGKKVLDWEVKLESTSPSSSKDTLRISNDMYPVFDEAGNVTGMVEVARSWQQDMKKTKKFIGLTASYTFDSIVGESPVIREKIRISKEFSNSPFPFLITGESGVGKELFAQSIHNYSARKKGPFVALNCANFSEGLIESELFGYVGGAFTGASKNGQIGKFELANGGTLFLDEIGELPYYFQSKLLRVLETWCVTRIGSTQQIPVDVRLIAATNKNLEDMVAKGLFRQDLYYRLQVLNVEIPPLRERKADLPLLADVFLQQLTDSNPTVAKRLSSESQQALMKYDWPGNVRELRNVINRAAILSKAEVIERSVLEASLFQKKPSGTQQ